jgi:hypothetical protein
MTLIKINNKHRDKILAEWSKVMLQTKTPMRKKLDEAVSNFLAIRTKAYQIAIDMVFDRVSASDLETFRKFKKTSKVSHLYATTTFDVEQSEYFYNKQKMVMKPLKLDYQDKSLDFYISSDQAVALHFDELLQQDLNPFCQYVYCTDIPDSFKKQRNDSYMGGRIDSWIRDNCPVVFHYNREEKTPNPFYFEVPDVSSNQLDLKVKTQEDLEDLKEHQKSKEHLTLSVKKLLEEHYTNLTKMREYLKTCKDTDDVKKVWNDFNHTILNDKIGRSVSIVSSQLVDDLKGLMELR